MTKTLVFYGGDAKAAKEQYKKPEADSFQYVQADAYNGERMEADEIAFMDDVDPGQRARIESIWGKFDNRISHDPKKVGGASMMASDPAANRGNLDPKTRNVDPDKVDAKELKHSGVAPKAGSDKPDPSLQDTKGVGLNAVTGKTSEQAKK